MRIRPIPFQKGPDDQPVCVDLKTSMFAAHDGDQSALIEEAIRFYNYGISGKPGIIYKNPAAWKAITAKTLIDAIHELRDGYNRTLRDSIENISKTPQLVRHLPDALIKDLGKDDLHGYRTLGDNANKGIFAVRTFLSDEWRSRNLQYRGRKNRALCRMLEKAADHLDDLRWAAGLRHITGMLQDQYGAPFGIKLIQPLWGGTEVIEPLWNLNPARYYAGDGNWYENLYGGGDKIGLSEKLYITLASSAFKPAHRLRHSTHTGHKGEACGPLEIIDCKVDYCQQKILPFGITARRNIWKTWFSNLDLLSARFGHAVRMNPRLAARTGLPWALALIGVLKVYLLDLMVRTLMLSLPVVQIYEEISGNGGVSLLEALDAGSARAPCIDGCLDTRWDWRLQEDGGPPDICGQTVRYYTPRVSGILNSWLRYPPVDPWNAAFELHNIVTHLFKDLSPTPLLIKPSTRTRKGRKPAEGISVSAFKASIYRFPPVERDFYTRFNMRRSLQNDLNFGMRYIVQAHLYVACVLLQKAKAIVGIDQLDWRKAKGFTLGDGCFLWGGKCPPHITHRDGRRMDLSYGPHIVPWPAVKVKEQIKWFNDFFKVDAENKRKHKTLLSVCYTNRQVEKTEKVISLKNIVFRELIGEVIYQHVNELRRLARRKPETYSEEEAQKYTDAEEKLIGTPHFYHTPDTLPKNGRKTFQTRTVQDWQMTHTGHLSILLSAPHHIVFASPIIHLRCMHIIRKMLSHDKKLLKAGSKIVGQTFFAFLPQDHHHHWHVEYLNPSTKDNADTSTADFEEYFTLWLALGIDFRPFQEYLMKIRSSAAEFQKLNQSLTRYNRLYLASFYPDGKENKAALESAQDLLESLFTPFKDPNSPFLRPTIVDTGGRFRQSKELKSTITASVKYFENIVTFYKLKQEIEKLTLQSYGYDKFNIPVEYIDIWGLENADELIEEKS